MAMPPGTHERGRPTARWGWLRLFCVCACARTAPTNERAPLETPTDLALVQGHDPGHVGGIVEATPEASGGMDNTAEAGPVVPIALRDGGPLECPQQFGKGWRYLINCDDRCVDPLADSDNCGGCGLNCATVAPSAPACVWGRCLLPSFAAPSGLRSNLTPAGSRRSSAVVRESRIVRIDGVDEHWWLQWQRPPCSCPYTALPPGRQTAPERRKISTRRSPGDPHPSRFRQPHHASGRLPGHLFAHLVRAWPPAEKPWRPHRSSLGPAACPRT
jgi:hypothetical protein